MMIYNDKTPDDEMTLAETEVRELMKLFVQSIGDRESLQHIEMISRGSNRLPLLVWLRPKKKTILSERR